MLYKSHINWIVIAAGALFLIAGIATPSWFATTVGLLMIGVAGVRAVHRRFFSQTDSQSADDDEASESTESLAETSTASEDDEPLDEFYPTDDAEDYATWIGYISAEK